MLKSFVYRLSLFSARHPWLILCIAALISVTALLAASRLPVYTSRQALLPQTTEVAHRLNRYLDTFGASSDLMVILENAPQPELEAFAVELAKRLGTLPEIGQATARLDTGFFHQHLYLLLPREQLDQIEKGLASANGMRIGDIQTLLALATTADSDGSSTKVDLQQAVKGIEASRSLLKEWQRWLDSDPLPSDIQLDGALKSVGAEQLGKGFFTSHDGKMLLVFVHAKAKGEDFETLAPLNEKVKATGETLAREFVAQGKTPPQVVLTGLPAIAYEEYIDIERDIKLVIWTSAALIGGLIFLVVRSLRWALAIFIPMGLGALWSLGFAYLTVGHLTIITSSFLAILFGLGADYGIFTTSQIAQARRHDHPLVDAIGNGIRDSFSAVMTAGGASLLIFGTLSTVEFPGFAELGIIAAGGVLLILISTWMVQPAIYALFPPKVSPIERKADDAKSSSRHIPKTWAYVLVMIAFTGAAIGIQSGLKMDFDYDVLALLPKDSKAAEYQKKMVTETDYQSEIVIFTAHSMDEIRRITDEASKLPTLSRVQSISQFFPVDGQERLTEAHNIALQASGAILKKNISSLSDHGLNAKDFSALKELLSKGLEKVEDYEEQAFSSGNKPMVEALEQLRGDLEATLKKLDKEPETARLRTEALFRSLLQLGTQGLDVLSSWKSVENITPNDLPAGIRERFVAADGTLAAYGYPAKSVYNPTNLDALMKDVYSVSPDATGFPSTHQVFSKAVVSSFSQGTKAAILVCLAWLIIIIRSPKGVLMAALPLVIGGGWMLGIMKFAGLHYNYANIIALPLVIALAVDYGVWLSHRWMAMDGADPISIAKDAGRVILLAAGTELAGLGAITLASYRGVSGLGIDITIGLLSCLASTLIIAPAIGLILSHSKKR
jgi:uncharacterized protein